MTDTNVVSLKEHLQRRGVKNKPAALIFPEVYPRPEPGPGQMALFEVNGGDQTLDAVERAVEINERLAGVTFPTVEGLPADWEYDQYMDVIEAALIGDSATQQALAVQGLILTALLIKKNQAYGNSVTAPISVFSKASPGERMDVRMDDKLNRLVNGLNDVDAEDAERDLAGYLVLRLAGKQTGALK